MNVNSGFASAHPTTVINDSGIDGVVQLVFGFGTKPLSSDDDGFKTNVSLFLRASINVSTDEYVVHSIAYLNNKGPKAKDTHTQ